MVGVRRRPAPGSSRRRVVLRDRNARPESSSPATGPRLRRGPHRPGGPPRHACPSEKTHRSRDGGASNRRVQSDCCRAGAAGEHGTTGVSALLRCPSHLSLFGWAHLIGTKVHDGTGLTRQIREFRRVPLRPSVVAARRCTITRLPRSPAGIESRFPPPPVAHRFGIETGRVRSCAGVSERGRRGERPPDSDSTCQHGAADWSLGGGRPTAGKKRRCRRRRVSMPLRTTCLWTHDRRTIETRRAGGRDL